MAAVCFGIAADRWFYWSCTGLQWQNCHADIGVHANSIMRPLVCYSMHHYCKLTVFYYLYIVHVDITLKMFLGYCVHRPKSYHGISCKSSSI